MILFTITFTRECSVDDDENGEECPLLKWQIELPAGASPTHALKHFEYEREDEDEEGEIEVLDVTWEGD